MSKDKLDTILENFFYIDDRELGEDKFSGHHSPHEAKRQIQELITEARIEELEKIMQMPGNAFVGNGENEIHWSTRNRLAQLRKDSNE